MLQKAKILNQQKRGNGPNLAACSAKTPRRWFSWKILLSLRVLGLFSQSPPIFQTGASFCVRYLPIRCFCLLTPET